MNRRHLEAILQMPFIHHRFFDTIVQQHPPHAVHPLCIACQHHDLNARLLPAFHLGLEHVHLSMEILHAARNHIDDILRSHSWHLTQENGDQQTLIGMLVDQFFRIQRQRQIRRRFAILHQMQIPFRFILLQPLAVSNSRAGSSIIRMVSFGK